MKRAISVALFSLAAVVLGGCPIYSDSHDNRVCHAGGCYDCPDPYFSDSCDAWACRTSSQCPGGYSCNAYGRCESTVTPPPGSSLNCAVPADCDGGTCGVDGRCHSEDCSIVSCASPYVCTLSKGVPLCTKPGPRPDGGTTDAGPKPSTCNSDKECVATAPGAKCLNGACVKPADQCTDTTQCGAGAQCVDGVCTPSCGGSVACPAGYQCDSTRGVCSQNPSPCTTNGQCLGSNVCVTGRCVNPCAGTTCATGLACVNGGCIADQKPTFACNADGTKADGVQDACKAGSICLRRSCYITCDVDGGAGDAGDACRSADAFKVCKSVATSAGAFAVCSKENGLGTECSPTGASCGAAKVCIDGICR